MVGALISLLVLAAPETEAGKKLQVAWNSQYEWKEDGVENVTLDFLYTYERRDKGGGERSYKGRGHVVVVGDEVVRRHFPEADAAARAELDGHLDWVLRRFVREPFAERFKDAKLEGPEPAAGGALKISAGRYRMLVKDDRLFGMEMDLGAAGKPFWVRVDFAIEKLRDGYALVGETCGYTRNTVQTAWSRKLEIDETGKVPAPKGYTYTRRDRSGKEEFTLAFDPARIDLAEPVVVDPKARDLLKAAWEGRYTLPAEIRIEGLFERKLDNVLTRARWQDDVRGQFQVWGMDEIGAVLDERLQAESWADRVRDTVTGHIQGMFKRLEPTPFEKEFEGCGFEARLEGKDTIVEVLGYEHALGFRIEKGFLTGHLDRTAGEPGWWEYKVKKTRDGFLIDRMSREFEDEDVTLRIRYGRKSGVQVPTRFDAAAVTGFWRGRGGNVGVATYVLRRMKVTLPDG